MFYSINSHCFMLLIFIDYCNSWSFWIDSGETNKNPIYDSNSNEIEESYDSFNIQSRSEDVKENFKKYKPSYTEASSMNDNKYQIQLSKHTWIDLAISLSRLVVPYIPESIQGMNIDWSQAKKVLRVFETSINSSVESFSTVAREVLPVAAPLMFDVTRILMTAVLQIMENSPGHSIVRRSTLIREDVVENMMKTLESLVQFTTGYNVSEFREPRDL
ncbi:unnamed protein product [Meganyctiphanes norvegica]|uniref:Uncharacterized protein n=1 Tax=Meganyctiphanes norvegica TaxID=48144 RepID=A0AAV2STZ9_MEGNR